MSHNDTMSEGSAADHVIFRGYNPALDGLRGFAIILVLFHHFWPWEWSTTVTKIISKLSGASWLGVDLFFVLSGFLITGILLDTSSKPNYFRNFISRRTLRIFPLYFAFLGLVFFVVPAILAAFGVSDPGFNASRKEASWYWLYLSNYRWLVYDPVVTQFFGMEPTHFVARVPEFLGVTWSLAVEEQFYLTWPLIVLLFRRKLFIPIVTLIALSISLRVFFVLTLQNWSDAAYMASICRADSLLTGAALAYYARLPQFSAKLWNRIAAVGLYFCLPLALVYQLAFHGPKDPVFASLGYTVTAFGFAGLLATVVRKRKSFITTSMTNRTLIWFGKYSYGLYLIHLLVWFFLQKISNAELYADGTPLHPDRFAPFFGNMLIDAPVRMLLALSLSMLGAWFSYNYFEKYFLSLKRFFEHSPK